MSEGLFRVKRLLANAVGRDFVVGDIHGHREQVDQLLDQAAFDGTRDRLFAVGDLVDRGPDSLGVLRLLQQPWFYSVMGNHEAYLLAGIVTDFNGAEWFRRLSTERQQAVLAQLRELPHVIVVGKGAQRFHVVHAQLHHPDVGLRNDADVDAGRVVVGTKYIVERLTEYRDLATVVARAAAWRAPPSPERQPGLSTTYAGHTILPAVGFHRSHRFIDTGACTGGALTMMEHATGQIYAVSAPRDCTTPEHDDNASAPC